MNKLAMCSFSVAFALIWSIGFAFAQDKVDDGKTQEMKKQDPVPPATGRNLPEQAGTQEPSSKVPGTNADPNAVFVNGALAVPGAPTDVDTVPSKFSARTAADDQVPIAAYRLRHLTEDQTREISSKLAGEQGGGAFRPAGADDSLATVGALIASESGLSPVPESLAAKFPELRGAAFMRSAGKLLIVDDDNRLVIGVLSGQ
jgi:hypothetical protein